MLMLLGFCVQGQTAERTEYIGGAEKQVYKYGWWKNDILSDIYLIVHDNAGRVFWQGVLQAGQVSPMFKVPEAKQFFYYWQCQRCYHTQVGWIVFKGDHPSFRTGATEYHNCTDFRNGTRRYGA
jgi:hypothetical protein